MSRPAERPLDRAWPALPIAALGIAALVAVLAIAFAPQRPAADQVRDAVEDLALAILQGRGEDACDLLVPATRAAVAAQTGTLGCAATVRTFGLGIDPGALRASTIGRVEVQGAGATIARTEIRSAAGQPFSSGVRLARDGGRWRVVAFTG